MILKIAWNGGWTLYDNLPNVSYHCAGEDWKQIECNNRFVDEKLDTEKMVIIADGKNPTPDAYLVLVVNVVTYLCNDEGKTIERIV